MTKVKLVKNTKPHAYQDAKYGKNMRVCNGTRKKQGEKTVWRDTVTGLEC